MKSTLLLASIGMLAAAISTASLGGVRESHSDGGAALRSVDRNPHGTAESVSRRSNEHADRHDGRDDRRDRGRGFDRGMQVVSTSAGPGEPGHGWRYFSDPAAGRAVAISPQGEYYYSRGKGLQLVAVTQPGS